MPQEGLIEVPGGRVWYHDSGDAPGIPLLCLHGGPGASSEYLAALASLAEDRRVVRYDQVGGGRSEYSSSDDLWRVARFVEELAQVRATLGLDRVHLYGHSWGTMLAVEHVLGGGTGIASLTLVSPWFSTPRYLEDVRALASALPGDAPAIIAALADQLPVPPDQVEKAVSVFYREHFCRDEEKLAALFAAGPPGPAYQAMWGPNEFHCTSPILASMDMSSRLGDLALPTLLMCGEYDTCTPATTRWFHSLIPDSEIAVLAGCSHMSILEDPQAHVGAVAGFIDRVERLGR